MSNSSGNSDGTCENNNNSTVVDTEGRAYSRILPCIEVCYDVLRKCPYYLPSEMQFDSNSQVLIYGGYPAFDCPRGETCSYSMSHDFCIGESSSLSSTIDALLLLSLTLLSFFSILEFN